MLRCILGDTGLKQHLQQNVAELLAEFVGVTTAHRVEQLVGFLQQESTQ